MQISVSGQHLAIGDHLQNHTKDEVTRVIKKYFAGAINAEIHFSKQGPYFICNILVTYGNGKHNVAKSNANSDEIYSALDISLGKLEKQFRKYKSKLKDHHADKGKASEISFEATKYVLSPTQHEIERDSTEDNPVIIAEKPTEILTLSVSKAVMKMDLEDLPAVIFKNSKTDRINIVYYRKDGNISWIDSK